MTEVKASLSAIAPEKKSDSIIMSEKCDDLWTSACLGDKGKWASAELLFTEAVAKKYFIPFLVGKEKVKVYGNPLTMYHRSLFWKDRVTQDVDTNADSGVIHLLPGLELSSCCCEFVVLWSYMNGVFDSSHYVKRTNLIDGIDQVLAIWNLHIYFGVKVYNVETLLELVLKGVASYGVSKLPNDKLHKLVDWSIGLGKDDPETADKVISVIRRRVLGNAYSQYTS